MTAQHTPKPWVYIGNGDIVARSEKYCGGEKDIASVFLTANDEDEANARLIAAAPDLLESAKLLIDSYDICRKDRTPDVIFERLRAAIAKATGEHHE